MLSLVCLLDCFKCPPYFGTVYVATVGIIGIISLTKLLIREVFVKFEIVDQICDMICSVTVIGGTVYLIYIFEFKQFYEQITNKRIRSLFVAINGMGK